MIARRRMTLATIVSAGLVAIPTAWGGELSVVAVEPVSQRIDVPIDGAMVVRFDRPVRRDSVTTASFWAFGRWSGPVDGAFSFSDGDSTVTLTPSRSYSGGETVTVTLSHEPARV